MENGRLVYMSDADRIVDKTIQLVGSTLNLATPLNRCGDCNTMPSLD